jgi:hypothetical protein
MLGILEVAKKFLQKNVSFTGAKLSLGSTGEVESQPYEAMRPSKGSQALVPVGTPEPTPTHDDNEDTLVIKNFVGGEDLGNQGASYERVLETSKKRKKGKQGGRRLAKKGGSYAPIDVEVEIAEEVSCESSSL